jgi:hypothetical protein
LVLEKIEKIGFENDHSIVAIMTTESSTKNSSGARSSIFRDRLRLGFLDTLARQHRKKPVAAGRTPVHRHMQETPQET